MSLKWKFVGVDDTTFIKSLKFLILLKVCYSKIFIFQLCSILSLFFNCIISQTVQFLSVIKTYYFKHSASHFIPETSMHQRRWKLKGFLFKMEKFKKVLKVINAWCLWLAWYVFPRIQPGSVFPAVRLQDLISKAV